jgi:hypothetical protein
VGVERWTPKQELSEQEQDMLLRMKRTGKLFAFLRRHRHELIDDALQEELEAMYRQTGAGKAPVPPGLLGHGDTAPGLPESFGCRDGGINSL